jgi:hypothetical protein
MSGDGGLRILARLVFGRRHVADEFEQPPVDKTNLKRTGSLGERLV